LGLREWVAEEIFPKIPFGFIVIDPFASRRKALKDLGSEEQIRKDIAEKYGETFRWIVSHDLKEIDKCDAMLVINNGGPSYGSAFETFYMAHVLKKPVFFVASTKYRNHPWLNHYCCCVTDDVDQAIESMKKYFDLNGD
jgi:nucleoside 2-deoxyribosyltransferase